MMVVATLNYELFFLAMLEKKFLQTIRKNYKKIKRIVKTNKNTNSNKKLR